jgi:hypothetical protein
VKAADPEQDRREQGRTNAADWGPSGLNSIGFAPAWVHLVVGEENGSASSAVPPAVALAAAGTSE